MPAVMDGETASSGSGSGGAGVERDVVRLLLNDAAESERALAAEELRNVQAHAASAGFDPEATTRVSQRLYGESWRGRVFGPGDRAPTEVVHYLRHRPEWPAGTTLDQYRQSLAEAVGDSSAGVSLERIGGHWQLTFVTRSGRWRGPRGGDWIIVGYPVDYGYWTTGYQPEDPHIHLVTRRPGSERQRWLRQPS